MRTSPEISCSGFTLVELVIVLFIIGIASAVVGIVLVGSLDSANLKTSAREVASTLRYARSHAVSEKKAYTFILYKDNGGSYMELLVENHDGEEGPILRKSFSEDIIAELEGEKWLQIDFFPLGNSSGGEIKLKNLKGSSFVVSVERVTGRVYVKG